MPLPPQEISVRRGVELFALGLTVLISGSYTAVKLSTDHLVNVYVESTAKDWAKFLAQNVTDLGRIAAGEQPSTASEAFLLATRKSDQVFRYIIFNADGYSQLSVDHTSMAPVSLSEKNDHALAAAKQKVPIVSSHSHPGGVDFPESFAEAYVPVIQDDRTVAVVGAYVDQAEARMVIRDTAIIGSLAIGAVVSLAFSLPAVAWYRRTREKQRADRRIQYLAHHDPLTGLANRARLTERLESALAVRPSLGGMIAVHFIDLDHFKQVNDMLGHDAGDFMLSIIGKRLQTMTRLEDVVGRLGGDEFVVVQTGIAEKSQVEAFGNRITELLGTPMYYKEQEITARVTIGVAIAPQDGETPDRLLKSADLALYTGKQEGRGRVRFFEPEMDETMRRRLDLERTIRDAVLHDGFTLHYQPVFEMSGKKLVGFEALARLIRPNGEIIPPAVFIPVAEEIRLIGKIGAWALREACRTAKTWPKDLTVAVNLSPAQFEGNDIEQAVATALKESRLEPARLELEITETLLLANNGTTLAILNRLKKIGVSIVMDDFGTGYSSLSYLWRFPFDKIKIDRSFMQSFGHSGRDVETVVKTIIALGRELNMRVTVEGVETGDQVDFLYGADADQVQGFYFGRPVPASELTPDVLAAFLKTATPHDAQAPAVKQRPV